MPGDDDKRMTLGEHLSELRRRLFYSVIALAVCFGVGWTYKEHLTEYVIWPWRSAVSQINADLLVQAEATLAAHPELARTDLFLTDDPADKRLREHIDDRLMVTSVAGQFFFALNVALYFALCASAPFVLFQVWAFVAAGLYRHEKSAILKYFPFSVLLFGAGVFFCYRWVIPVGLYFLSSTLPFEQVRVSTTLDEYFSFLSTMCLAMGLIFQLPLVMLCLSRIGLVDPGTWGKYRAHFLVGALFVAAIVTPGPDYYSQILMTIPMVLLYEIGILLSKFVGRRRSAPTGGAEA